MSLQLESQPSYQSKINQEHRERRSKWASKAVADLGIDLRRRREVMPHIEALTPPDILFSYRPPLLPVTDAERDWIFLSGDAPTDESYPANIVSVIFTVVSRYTGHTKVDLRSQRRTNDIVVPRHMAIYLCRYLTPRSLPEIGRYCGGRDHTTALHATRKTAARMLKNADICQSVAEMSLEIEAHIAEWRALRTRAKITEYVASLRTV